MLAQYNAVISNVAKVTHIPLLNLYHLKTENGDLINPTNGTLTGGANKPLDFTPVGLKIGNNFAAKVFLEMLSALKNAIPLP